MSPADRTLIILGILVIFGLLGLLLWCANRKPKPQDKTTDQGGPGFSTTGDTNGWDHGGGDSGGGGDGGGGAA